MWGSGAARTEVDHRICVRDTGLESGPCRARIDVLDTQPARKYVGLSLLFPQVGVTWAHVGADEYVGYRGELGLEYLRGSGVYGLSLRASALLEGTTSHATLTAFPLSVAGHISLDDRVSLHAGMGYSPYSVLQVKNTDAQPSYSVVRGLVGTQLLLLRSGEFHLTLNPEFDVLYDLSPSQSYRSVSSTLSLAAHF